jgi:hypothetical protein
MVTSPIYVKCFEEFGIEDVSLVGGMGCEVGNERPVDRGDRSSTDLLTQQEPARSQGSESG